MMRKSNCGVQCRTKPDAVARSRKFITSRANTGPCIAAPTSSSSSRMAVDNASSIRPPISATVIAGTATFLQKAERANSGQCSQSRLRAPPCADFGDDLRQPFHHALLAHLIRHAVEASERFLHPHPQNHAMHRLDADVVQRIHFPVHERAQLLGRCRAAHAQDLFQIANCANAKLQDAKLQERFSKASEIASVSPGSNSMPGRRTSGAWIFAHGGKASSQSETAWGARRRARLSAHMGEVSGASREGWVGGGTHAAPARRQVAPRMLSKAAAALSKTDFTYIREWEPRITRMTRLSRDLREEFRSPLG